MRILSRAWQVGLTTGSLGLLGGCRAPAAPVQDAPHFIVADVILSVTNHSRRERQVSLESGSVRRALGVVPAGASRSFSLPSGFSSSPQDLHFRADGGPASIRSENLHLAAGRKVVWTIDDSGGSVVTHQ